MTQFLDLPFFFVPLLPWALRFDGMQTPSPSRQYDLFNQAPSPGYKCFPYGGSATAAPSSIFTPFLRLQLASVKSVPPFY